MRASGPGGQHVNKADTAVQLRFDIQQSSLPDFYKKRIQQVQDNRINSDGVVVIKSQEHRSQLRNKEAALERLQELLREISRPKKKRKLTKPSKSQKAKRMDNKRKQGEKKQLRAPVKLPPRD